MLTCCVASRLPLESRFESRGGPGTFPLQARSSEDNTAMPGGVVGRGAESRTVGLFFIVMTTALSSPEDSRLY